MKDKLPFSRKLTLVLFAAVAMLYSTGIVVFAQDETKTRTIDAEDFLKNRPKDGIGSPNQKSGSKKSDQPKSAKPAKYNYVRKEKAVSRIKNKTPRPTPVPAEAAKTSDIGVTIWRLRPALPGETGPKIAVKTENGNRELMTPERVGSDNVFRAGDKVRFAVESTTAGHLYVVNSEIYSDGSYGAPFLIFPASANENNRVRPGLLVEIPDQTESDSYFKVDPKRANYVGELLTVIVSPRPLTNLKTDAEARIINVQAIAGLEENAEVEIFAKEGGAGETYTKEEKAAVCDQKTRQLVKEKAEPCAKTRQLTRNEPPPQTIYRVKSAAGQPVVLSVRLNVEPR